MKKNLKIFVVLSIVVIIFITIFYIFYIKSFGEKDVLIDEKQNFVSNIVEDSKISEPKFEDEEITKEKTITLLVLDKVYNLEIKDGDTLYMAMERLRNEENNFSFNSKEYPSLGIFINEINGIKETAGKYWIYYINGKEASVGVSKYFPQDGDIISWKQE